MYPLVRSLSAPLLSLILMMLGSGLFNTFTSIRMEMAGYSARTIGFVTSALYVGILIGSLSLGKWIGKKGHIRSLIIFAGASTLLAMAQSIWTDPFYWGHIRFFSGVCMAGIFIVIESWLLVQSPPTMRGQILSVYLAVFYGALSAGQFLINVASLDTIYPFCIAASFFGISILPVLTQKTEEPIIEQGVSFSLIQLFKTSPLGFLGGVVSGMLLATVYGLIPLYAKDMGMNVSDIGLLMAVIIFGGLSFQWPLGFWADRSNRRQVLNIVSLSTAILALGIGLLPQGFSWVFFILAWFFGGFSFTIYPLSMAFTCEKIDQNQIVAATAGFILTYGIGAIAGPLLAPFVMAWYGTPGLFYFLSAITFILMLAGLPKALTNLSK